MALTAQLRMYRVKPGEMNAFVRDWKAGVVPLRKKFGFTVEGAWTIASEDRFVWILRYDGPEGFEARDAAYYASEERKALKPNPAEHLVETATWLMERADP